MDNWYDKKRGKNDKNSKLMDYIGKKTQELAKEEISWEIFKYDSYLKDFLYLNLEKKKEDILKLVEERHIEGLAYLGIDWEDKKEDIWNLTMKKSTSIYLAGLGIDWSDKRDEIWKISKIREWGIMRSLEIDWSYKKDELWNQFQENLEQLPDLGIDWSDKKNELWKRTKEIWELDRQNNNFDRTENMFWVLSRTRIDWSEEKETIWNIAQEIRRSEKENQIPEYRRYVSCFIKFGNRLVRQKRRHLEYCTRR